MTFSVGFTSIMYLKLKNSNYIGLKVNFFIAVPLKRSFITELHSCPIKYGTLQEGHSFQNRFF